MPRSGLGLHSFDPPTLSILYAVYDEAVAALDAEVKDVNRHRIHTAVAKAIIDLAKTGQLDPTQLKRYAMAQGRSAMDRADFALNEPLETDDVDLQQPFQGCPRCGSCHHILSVGADYWAMCWRRQVKWFCGFNIFPGWQHKMVDEWLDNSWWLANVELVVPIYPADEQLVSTGHYGSVRAGSAAVTIAAG